MTVSRTWFECDAVQGLQRPPGCPVVAKGALEWMAAFLHCLDAVMRQPRRSSPNHNVAVEQFHAPSELRAFQATPEKDGGKPQRDGHDGGIEPSFVLVLMQGHPRGHHHPRHSGSSRRAFRCLGIRPDHGRRLQPAGGDREPGQLWADLQRFRLRGGHHRDRFDRGDIRTVQRQRRHPSPRHDRILNHAH